MAQRQFSPDQKLTHQLKSSQTTDHKKLRQAGSTNDLLSHKIFGNLNHGAEIIGHYSFKKSDQIGSGYTSKVYKAISSLNQQVYAIKVIQLKKYSASSLVMLQTEIEILSKLNHPNVIHLQNVYKTASHCYLVTEYCEKGDLLEYMTKKGKISEMEATEIMTDVIEGLKYLFKMGVIHRDVKPANILRGTKSWKLADFGFSIHSEQEIKTRHNVGTPLYMPLESLVKNVYSPQSDIFAVGIIFYQLMIGITPWECNSQKQLIKKMNNVTFKIPEKFKISSHLQFLLEKLCAVKKDDRMTKEQFMNIRLNNFVSLHNFNQSSTLKKQNPEDHRLKRISSSKIKENQNKVKQENESKTKENESKTKENKLKNEKIKMEYKLKDAHSKRKISVESSSKNRKKSLKRTQSNQVMDIKTYQLKNKLKGSQQSQDSRNDNKFDEKLDNKNYNILVNQLNFCRFMYYMVINIENITIAPSNYCKISLILFKHLVKIMKQLADDQVNWFGFTNWDHFRKSDKYLLLFRTFQDYSDRYEKEYVAFLKRIDIAVVKDINLKLPEFGINDPLTISFYRKLQAFLSPFLRQCNHNLAINLQENQPDSKNGKIEGMRSMFQYYRLIEMNIKEYQNHSFFERNSGIQIVKNYRSSSASLEDYLRIRTEVKNC